MKRGYDKAETQQLRKTKCQKTRQMFIKFTNTVQTLPLAQLTQTLLGSRLNQELKQLLQAVDRFFQLSTAFFSCHLHCVGVSTRQGDGHLIQGLTTVGNDGVSDKSKGSDEIV